MICHLEILHAAGSAAALLHREGVVESRRRTVHTTRTASRRGLWQRSARVEREAWTEVGVGAAWLKPPQSGGEKNSPETKLLAVRAGDAPCFPQYHLTYIISSAGPVELS